MRIANINLLVRFNKIREIFPYVTQLLSIVLAPAAAGVDEGRVSSGERVTRIPCSVRATSYARGGLSAVVGRNGSRGI